jgi:hemolysin III
MALKWSGEIADQATPRRESQESAAGGNPLNISSGEFLAGMVSGSGYRFPRTPALDLRTSTVSPARAEELANTITHGVGLALSLTGLYSLVHVAGRNVGQVQAAGCAVYGASLVLLYAASTLYHGWQGARMKRVLLLLDHIAIYVLIAGTYTPLALIPLRGTAGLVLLVAVWGFALVGSITKVIRIDRLDEDSPLPYVVMSFMVTVVIGRLIERVPAVGFYWLLAGGALYAMGLHFFIRSEVRFNHAIWHLFVLAGSICHYAAVTVFVVADTGAI